MIERIVKWARKYYHKIISSIAFFPAVVAISFLIVSYFMLQFDYSETGKNIKSHLSWLTLKDASTARTVVATILGGIISLTVFSFSMVMIVLNQAASQMSNRVLEDMIGNRFQQFVLGVYIGSTVYALFLLSNIRDIASGIYIPALSIYLLLLITVIDIFIFIYFLHYVTQSVKFDTIINRVYEKTVQSLNRVSTSEPPITMTLPDGGKQIINTLYSGYFQGMNKKELVAFAAKRNAVIHILHPKGSFFLQGIPFIEFYSSTKLLQHDIEQLFLTIDFDNGQPIELNPYYGYHQLTEVALKALSPGINDPETAVLSIQALTNLLDYKLMHFVAGVFMDEQGNKRLFTTEKGFAELFKESFYPIWDYGKNDRYIQNAFLQLIPQLQQRDTNKLHTSLFQDFKDIVLAQKEKNHPR